jgi:flagellar motility protein MotE (MotC chaperone)
VSPSVPPASPSASSATKAGPTKASATVTSSFEYTSEAVEIAEVVRVVMEAKTVSVGREKPTDKGSTSSTATKRGRRDSQSPPPKKRFSKGGAQGLTAQLRKSEAEWQDRAARAEEDLKKVREDYRALEKEYRAAKTKWETDRTRLANAAKQKDAADKAVEASQEARQKLAKLQKELEQVTSEHESLLARNGAWEGEKQAMEAHIVTLTDEIEKWRRDACYRLPNGRLKLVHYPS